MKVLNISFFFEVPDMRLILRRDQAKKGMIKKKMRFILYAKVELTEREHNIIKKYDAEMEPLFEGTSTFLGRTAEYKIRVHQLIKGYTWNCEDVLTIMNTEEKVRTACDNLKLIIELMESFGGEEVIEISMEKNNGETP